MLRKKTKESWFSHLRVFVFVFTDRMGVLCHFHVTPVTDRRNNSVSVANVMIEWVIFIKPIRAIWLVYANRLGKNLGAMGAL